MGSLVGWEGEEWRSTPDIREGEVTVEEVPSLAPHPPQVAFSTICSPPSKLLFLAEKLVFHQAAQVGHTGIRCACRCAASSRAVW